MDNLHHVILRCELSRAATQRVESNGEWSLFCPSEAPGLADTWGPEFEALYAKYEGEGRAKKVIRAQSLWFAIMDAQVRDVLDCELLLCVQTPAARVDPVPFAKH